MRFQIGAFFPTRDMPADRVAIRDWAQAAEAIGFHFVEVSDHVLGADRAALPDFQGPYDVNDAFHETFVTLSYIAAVTERVGLASGVLILPQRQTTLVAKQAAQVDIVSGGRLRLGIGVGWNPVEYEALGQDWHVRGRRQAEQVVLMHRLWTERTVTFEGAFDRVQHAGINPLPIQRPSRSGSVVALRRCCGGRHDMARGGYHSGTPTNGRRASWRVCATTCALRVVIQARSASKPGSVAASADQSNGGKRQSAGTPWAPRM